MIQGGSAFLDDKVVIYEAGVAEQSKKRICRASFESRRRVLVKITRKSCALDGAANFARVATEGRQRHYKDRDINLITTETMVLHRERDMENRPCPLVVKPHQKK